MQGNDRSIEGEASVTFEYNLLQYLERAVQTYPLGFHSPMGFSRPRSGPKIWHGFPSHGVIPQRIEIFQASH